MINAALIIGAYLLGSVPHLRALARLRHINLNGDYHMSLWQRAGKWITIAGILLDFVKGAAPVLVGYLLDIDLTAVAVAGVAVVCGQMWPIFQRFDGEKGNTTGVGMAAALDYRPFLIAAVFFALGAGIRIASRIIHKRKSGKDISVLGGPFSLSMPLGMLAGFLALPVASWLLDEPEEITWAFGALFVLIVVRRLTAGITRDLQASNDIKRILAGRLFLDRGISRYRVS
ncbi:MAG: glycerol-3-phosphate acyltransferase [Dehalococcoidales bacterium]|nr:glycerol-3-phosphate acyltransferase [Dehalococcoidales bacterium]